MNRRTTTEVRVHFVEPFNAPACKRGETAKGLAPFCAQDEAAQERFYQLRRRTFVELAGELSRCGDSAARSRDWECASLLQSFAAMLNLSDRAPGEKFEEDLRKLRSEASFRSSLQPIVALGRSAAERLRRLQAHARQVGLAEEASVLETLATECSMFGPMAEGVRRLNDYRAAAKLPPVGMSQELCHACFLHCRYMAVEGDVGHDERESSGHYDPEGERAGRASVITTARDLPHAVDLHMSTLYHRVALLDPGTRAVGIAAWPMNKRLATAIDARRCAGVADGIVIFPAPGQKNVPAEFCLGEGRESPSPLPPSVDRAGYPVTLSFFGRYAELADSEAPEIRLEDASGREVACRISTPASPANRSMPDNSRTLCAIPFDALKKKTQYRAVFTLKLEGGRRKTFETTFTTTP
jgi:hypothetical protein